MEGETTATDVDIDSDSVIQAITPLSLTSVILDNIDLLQIHTIEEGDLVRIVKDANDHLLFQAVPASEITANDFTDALKAQITTNETNISNLGSTVPDADTGSQGDMIRVDGSDAFELFTPDFATSAQGDLADSAIQPGDLTDSANGTNTLGVDFTETSGTITATVDASDYIKSADAATTAQGDLADSAIQPADFSDTANDGNTLGVDFTETSGTITATVDVSDISDKIHRGIYDDENVDGYSTDDLVYEDGNQNAGLYKAKTDMDGYVEGIIEVQTIQSSGTRSNVVGSAQDEEVTISIRSDFRADIDHDLIVTDFNDIVFDDPNDLDVGWPSGGTTNLPSGWSYTEPSEGVYGGPNLDDDTYDSYKDHAGYFTNNTGFPVATENFNLSISGNCTAANETNRINVILGSDESFFINERALRVSTDNNGDFDAIISEQELENFRTPVIPDGERIYVLIITSIDSEFTITIDSIELELRPIEGEWSLNLDTDNDVFSSNGVSDTVDPGDNAEDVLDSISADILAASGYSGVTAGSVFTETITTTHFTRFSVHAESGELTTNTAWTLRDGPHWSDNNIQYTSWNDFVGNWFVEALDTSFLSGGISGDFQHTSIDLRGRGSLTGVKVILTDHNNQTTTATFVLEKVVTIDRETNYNLVSLESSSGTPPNDMHVAIIIEQTFEITSLTFDLNTNTDVDNSFAFTRNSSINPDIFLVAQDGTGPASTVHTTYTLNDFNSGTVTSFTSFVTSSSNSDIQDVLDTIVEAVNDNTETPIDFVATEANGKITFTAQSSGNVSGAWSVTVNNGGNSQAGNIEFATTVEDTIGGTQVDIPLLSDTDSWQQINGLFTSDDKEKLDHQLDEWNATTNYDTGDEVIYNGIIYVNIISGVSADEPDDTTAAPLHWDNIVVDLSPLEERLSKFDGDYHATSEITEVEPGGQVAGTNIPASGLFRVGSNWFNQTHGLTSAEATTFAANFEVNQVIGLTRATNSGNTEQSDFDNTSATDSLFLFRINRIITRADNVGTNTQTVELRLTAIDTSNFTNSNAEYTIYIFNVDEPSDGDQLIWDGPNKTWTNAVVVSYSDIIIGGTPGTETTDSSSNVAIPYELNDINYFRVLTDGGTNDEEIRVGNVNGTAILTKDYS